MNEIEKTETLAAHRLPDFVIGGAPKCGTTSLHFILAQHPDIGIPHDEVFFFDADDPIVHPDFMHTDGGELKWWNPDPSSQVALDWYARHFEPFEDKRFVGEDSTTYLMSEVASARINMLLPDSKLIFMFRNPVKRAYSQYWHLMKTGRVSTSFEETLLKHNSILGGSTYTPHLRRYIRDHGADNIHVVLFEDFLADMQGELDRVTDFIGASRFNIDADKTWFNKTYYPTSGRAQRMLNLIGKRLISGKYRHHMGAPTRFYPKARRKLQYWWFKYINGLYLKAESPEPMNIKTEQYLKKHLTMRNKGLSELLDRDFHEVWGLDV